MQVNDYDLVDISERGEGQENECPVCGAEAEQFCSEPLYGTILGVELGRQVHRARLSSNVK